MARNGIEPHTSRPISASSPAQDPKPSLPPYKLLEFLGSGTYAKVYRAERPKLHLKRQPTGRFLSSPDVFAVKCIRRSGVRRSRTAVEVLVTEIAVLKKLRHPHIVEMVDFHWDSSYIYIVMEYCVNGDFHRVLHDSRGKVPESLARYYFRQLCDAMCYLNSQRVAHLDLKPKNLLLTRQRRLKVADFGFAKFVSQSEDSDCDFALRGTPLYMAPEIVRNAVENPNCTNYDGRADLWSCGIILYEIMFGLPPIVGITSHDVLSKLMAVSRIQIPSTKPISKDCEDILKRLLCVDPDERITFQQLSTHAFVDLESFHDISTVREKADNCINCAEDFENQQLFTEAIDNYCQAVRHLLDMKQISQDPSEKESLHQEMLRLTTKAEDLRKKLKPLRPKSAKFQHQNSSSNLLSFSEMFSDDRELLAKYRESGNSFLDPLIEADRYDDARGILVEVIELFLRRLKTSDLSEEKRARLRQETEKLMEKAEHLKSKAQLLKAMPKEAEVSNPVGDSTSSMYQKCVLQ